LIFLYNDVKIATIFVKKEELPSNRKDNIHKMYEEIAKKLLVHLFESNILPSTSPIDFIASRRETNKHLNTSFIASIENVSTTYKVNMKVQIQTPYKEK
jgi:hypothetical protein